KADRSHAAPTASPELTILAWRAGNYKTLVRWTRSWGRVSVGVPNPGGAVGRLNLGGSAVGRPSDAEGELMRTRLTPWALLAAAALAVTGLPGSGRSACCYFSAKDKDILQPGQKVFISWDPMERTESWTVQPKFEGNAQDFGMVIPTPAKPKLDEMPRDFFKELAVFTILKRREQPQSRLLPAFGFGGFGGGLGFNGGFGGGIAGLAGGMGGGPPPRRPAVQVVESGVVGALDYKVLTAGRSDDLYTWLKENKYHYAGDEATLDFYVKKKWFFTVMKIDTMQMKRKADGTFSGEVTPTRF